MEKSILKDLHCEKLMHGQLILRVWAKHFLNGIEKSAKRKAHATDNPKNYRIACGQAVREKTKKLAPYFVDGKLPTGDGGLVIGFNHPSLGEIVRIVIMLTEKLSADKEIVFPVKLTYYEILEPFKVQLGRMFGVQLMPIITPKLYTDMIELRPEYTREILAAEKKLQSEYLNKVYYVLRRGGAIIVAPAARRHDHIFTCGEQLADCEPITPQTMSLLEMAIHKEQIQDVSFVPMLVIPPEDGNDWLNPHLCYGFVFGEPFTEEEAYNLAKTKCKRCKGREFERIFLTRIANLTPDYGRTDLVMPRSI